MDQSLNFSSAAILPKDKRYGPYKSTATTEKLSKRSNSRSKKQHRERHSRNGKHKDMAGGETQPNPQGYIFNIQTSATDIMKGIHNYQSTKGSRDYLPESAS